METKKPYNNNTNLNTSATFNSSNMVLSRPNTSNGISVINLTNNSNNNLSDSRNGYHHSNNNRQNSNSKYGHKSRNGGDDFTMLQRPTPTILAKPVQNTSLKPERDESKDENLKPQSNYSRNSTLVPSTANPAVIQSNKAGTNSKLLNENGVKNGYSVKPSATISSNNPILANLSTNLASAAKPKSLSQQQKEATPLAQTAQPITANMSFIESLSIRLSNNTEPMTSPVKILDENLQWNDGLVEFLTDQPDFLVVGVLGKKGVGKSTLMSLLAGSKFEENDQILFKSLSSAANSDLAQHKTNGIQAFVTNERTIFLDVQPLLSGSVLDKTINMDKKHLNNDFKYYENFIEMQSIELACFILSVCNVVVVLEDWFLDTNLFRILQTAEMLMPNNSLAQQEEYQIEHHPHIVYALNKIEYINKNDIAIMKASIDSVLKDSKLIYKGSINGLNGLQMMSSRTYQRNTNNRNNEQSGQNVNFVFVPKEEKSKQSMAEFNGLPSLDRCIKYLLREILAVRRTQSAMNPLNIMNGSTITSTTNTNTTTATNNNSTTSSNLNNLVFSEKRWFSYANKVWETIRKSQLIGEYNRLMT